MRFATSLLTIMLISLLSLQSQNSEESAFAGTHFIMGFMQNEVDIMTGGRTHKIILTAQDTTKIEVLIPGRTPIIQYAVPDTAYEYYVDYDFVFDTSEEIGTDLVEIKSEKPIVCYAFSAQLKSTDSYIAYPVETWGKEYIITSMGIDHYYPDETLPPGQQDFRNAKRPGEFLIIASVDSTKVYIKPSDATEKDWAARGSEIMLNKGEAYLVKAFPAYYGDNDLTGSYVKSDKPIGVLSGHVRASIPQKLMKNKDSKDHLVEMIFSIDRWSNNYISVPFEIEDADTGDLFKITSAYDSTVVNMLYDDKVEQFKLNGIGDFKAIDKVDKPVRWVSNKPIQIAQFMSHGVDFIEFYPMFDPSMLMLPSPDKMVKSLFYALPKYIFEYYRYTEEEQFIAHKICLLMTQNAVDDIAINGTLIKGIDSVQITHINGTDLYYSHVPISIGSNKIATTNGYFAAWTYGYGEADSYAMTLGSSLVGVSSSDSISPNIFVDADCGYLEGYITDFIGVPDGGLGSLMVIENETDNYKLEIISKNIGKIEFFAEPEDVLKDGYITFDYRDMAGNGGVYKYSYKGINVEFQGDFGIPNTELGTDNFAMYKIKNNADTIRTIYSITFYKDTRLSYELLDGKKLPYKMSPGEELYVKIIFSPIENPEDLNDSVYVRTDCNYVSRARVKGGVLVPNLNALTLDFGKVLIYTQKEKELIVINNGFTDLILENMDYIEYNSVFEIDTLGIFPRKLLIDDTLRLKVIFSPIEKKNYLASVYFNNDKNISNSATITGIGAAPNVKDLVVDWGKRRVGSINDTTVYLHNVGDWQAKVDYNTTEINTQSDSNLDVLEALDNTILEVDSLRVDLSYIPIIDENYEMITSNTIFELKDTLFDIHLLGEPTLPEITIHDIYLGTVILGSDTSGIYKAIETDGNENLDIKSITPINPLNSEFVTDISSYQGQSFTSGTTINTNVSFKANELGRRYQYYLIEHDALPNYQYRSDTLRIYADVAPKDTILPELLIHAADGELCRNQDLRIEIQNRGNVDFTVTDLTYSFDTNPYWVEPNSFTMPDTVKYGESSEYILHHISKDTESNILYIYATVNDSIKIEKQVELLSNHINNVVTQIISIEGQVGSFDTLFVSGDLPKTKIDYVEMDIEIEVDYEILNYLGDEMVVIIIGGGEQDTIKSKITVLQNRIFLSEPIEINSQDEDVIWTVVLPFRILYKSELSSQVKFKAELSACYTDIVEKIAVKVLPNCIFDLLPIKINDKLPSVSINSRIVDRELGLEVFIPEADYIFTEIYTVTGAKINSDFTRFLEKGVYDIQLNIDKLPVGTYLLNIQYQQYNKKILFIKSI